MNMNEYCGRCAMHDACKRDEVYCQPQYDDCGHFDGCVCEKIGNERVPPVSEWMNGESEVAV